MKRALKMEEMEYSNYLIDVNCYYFHDNDYILLLEKNGRKETITYIRYSGLWQVNNPVATNLKKLRKSQRYSLYRC